VRTRLDGTEDDGSVGGVEEPQTGQVGPQGPVVAHGGVLIPGVQPHGRVQAGCAGPSCGGAGVAAGGFVGEDQLEKRRVGQVLMAGQREPLGQGVEHGREFELTHHLLQVGRDRVIDNLFGGLGHHSPCCSCSVAPPSMTCNQSGRGAGR
jgi:hypothetical protein